MKFIALILIGFIYTIIAKEYVDITKDGNPEQLKLFSTPATYVFNLTDENYDNNVIEGTEWIIQYTAPWAKLCEIMDPIFNSLAENIKDELPHLKFGRINVEDNNIIASRFFIARLPTIFYIKNRYEIRLIKGLASSSEPYEDLLLSGRYLKYPLWDKESSWLHPYTLTGDISAKWGSISKKISYYTKDMPKWLVLLITSMLSGWIIQWLHGVNGKSKSDFENDQDSIGEQSGSTISSSQSDSKKDSSKNKNLMKKTE